MRKLELFLKGIFDFTLGRAKRERVWEKEFLPALAWSLSAFGGIPIFPPPPNFVFRFAKSAAIRFVVALDPPTHSRATSKELPIC